MAELTHQDVQDIIGLEPVSSILDLGGNISLSARAEPPGFVIEAMPTEDHRIQNIHFLELLRNIDRAAKDRDIVLRREDFEIKEAGTGAADGNPMGGVQGPSWTKPTDAEAEAMQSEAQLYESIQAAPQQSFIQQRQIHDLEKSLRFNHKELVAALNEKLGPDYAAEYGLVEGKPAVTIRPVSFISQILMEFGMAPESDKTFAEAVMQSFSEVLGREPKGGEIVINDTRAANVTKMRLLVRDTSRSLGMM